MTASILSISSRDWIFALIWPVVTGLAAVDPPQVVVLQAEEADQAGDVWRWPALSCPDWHPPVDRVVAVTGPATRQAENQQPEDGGEKKNLR